MKRFLVNPWTACGAAALLIAAFIGCNQPAEQVEPTTPEPQPAAEPEEPAELTWADMNDEQRAALMRDEVMPAMRPLFQQWEPEEFSVFTCMTCHGQNFQEVGYHMPNGVHPMTREQVMEMADSEEDEVVGTFLMMSQQVVPGMAGILDMETYNPETGQGFGCFNCHENAAAAEATSKR